MDAFLIEKYLVLFGCILISITIGNIPYCFGNILPYFSSYIAYKNISNNNILNDNELITIYNEYQYQTNTIYCLLMIFQSVSMAFGNKIYLIFGFQRSCLLGCFILSFGIGLTYFTSSNLFLSCLTFGIMTGIGSGIIYPTLIISIITWWPNKKKLMAAIISCSYAAGPVIFNISISYFINPNNIKPNSNYGYLKNKDLMYNFPDLFVFLALIFSLIQVIGILCLRNPNLSYNHYLYSINQFNENQYKQPSFSIYDDMYYKQQKQQQQQHYEPPDALNDHSISNHKQIYQNQLNDYTLNECIHLWEFWKLIIITTLNITICMFIIALYQDFSLNYLKINNPLYLSWIGSISSIFHSLFRLFYSSFYDYCVSFQKSNGTTSVILTCFVATISLCKFGGNIMIFLWCIVLFSCLGSIYTFIPKCVAKTFGITNYTEISSIIMLSEIPASIIFGLIAGNAKNSINSYNNILIILCIFGIISVVLTLSFSPQNLNKQRKKYLKNNANKNIKVFNANNNNNNNNYNNNNESTFKTLTENYRDSTITQKSSKYKNSKQMIKNNGKIRVDSITNIIFKYESCIPPYLAVIGGTLIMITIGTTFCFGNIKPYIASYLAYHECKNDNNCNNINDIKHLYSKYSHKSNWIFCVAVIFEAIASVIGGKLELYLGAEYCALLGCSILSFGCALTHYGINNISTIILTYGVLFGFGAGIAFKFFLFFIFYLSIICDK